MKRTSIALASLLLAACASAPTPPLVDANAKPCALQPGGAAPGEWLIGRWRHPHNTLVIRREGEAIVYAWEREAGVESPTWGDKAPANGSGRVSKLSGCTVVMTGRYDWSTTQPIVGRVMEHKLELVSPRRLQGLWFGAGRRWLAVAWQRDARQ